MTEQEKHLLEVLAAIKTSLDSVGTAAPSGGATSGRQDAGNAILATIATNTGRLPAQGAAAKAASLPVNIASDQNLPIEGTAASNAPATAKPILVGGKYNSTVQTFDDGDIANLQVDINGRLIVTNGTLTAGEDLLNNTRGVSLKPVAAAQYSPSFVQNAGTATAGNAKASAGAVLKARGTNANAAVRFLQVHNSASAPAAGATPLKYWAVPGGTTASPAPFSTGDINLYCSSGVSWAWSTTATR
jgi:hypothetical protein